MAKQDSKSRTFLKKLRDPYRMVIINEETFEEQLQFRISRLRVILLSSTFFALLCSIIFISIAFSPLKELIPGYDSSELRQKAIQNLFVTDSLIDQYDKNIQYLNAVRAVLSEEITFQDPELSEAERPPEDALKRARRSRRGPRAAPPTRAASPKPPASRRLPLVALRTRRRHVMQCSEFVQAASLVLLRH